MLIQSSPFLRHPVTMGGALLPPYYPSSLSGLQLYLDTRLGLSSVLDTGNISTWPDQSGHSPTRDAVAQAGWNTPTLARSGTNLTPKGLPSAVWATPDAVTPQGLGAAGSIGAWPSLAAGYTIYWYGRPHQKTTPAWGFVNQHWFGSDGGSGTNVFGIMNTGGAPQSYGIQDNAGGGNPHRFGTTASVVEGWHLFTLQLPAGSGSVPCRFWVDGVEITQVSGPANYTSGIGTGQYILGNSIAGNISMRAEMGFLAWYNTAHSAAQIALFKLWASIYWGF